MDKIVNNVETGFFFHEHEWEKLYGIYDSDNRLVAIIWKKIVIDRKTTSTYCRIEYDLQYASGRTFSQQERRMISYYYHNIVRVITNDIQTIFTDNINERLQLPFYTNLLHIEVL